MNQLQEPKEREPVEELTSAQREFAKLLGRLLAKRWQEEQSLVTKKPMNDKNTEVTSPS